MTSNRNALLYTGLSNLDLFESVHSLVMPLIRGKWVGSSKSLSQKKIQKITKPIRCKTKLWSQDERLSIFIKINLGLLEQDLASRFEISISIVSKNFVIWVKGLSSVLKCFKTFIVYTRAGKLKYYKTNMF